MSGDWATGWLDVPQYAGPMAVGQLNSYSPTSSADCGPASTIQSLWLVTGGRFVYLDWRASKKKRADLIHDIRVKGGMRTTYSSNPMDMASTIAQNRTAFIKYDDVLAGYNIKPPKTTRTATNFYTNGWTNYFRPDIESGKAAQVLIRTRIFYDSSDGYIATTSRPSTTSAHIVTVYKYHTVGSVEYIKVLDPLCDGRYGLPLGPQTITLALLKKAMGGYSAPTGTPGTPEYDPGTAAFSTGSTGAQFFSFTQSAEIIPSSNGGPTAKIGAGGITDGVAPFTANLSGSASSDPDGDVLTYAWDLDEDDQYDDSTALSVVKVYDVAGTYYPSLRVTDTSGVIDTVSKTIYVAPAGTPPAIAIDPFPRDPCETVSGE